MEGKSRRKVKAASQPSLKEVLQGVPPEMLDQPCRDEHLCDVARHVTNWPYLAPFLEISRAEMEEIRGKWPFSVPGQKIEFLRKWHEKRGRKATYRRLCKAFLKIGDVALAEKVCDIISSRDSSSSDSSYREDSDKSGDDERPNTPLSPVMNQDPSEAGPSPLTSHYTVPPTSSDSRALETETCSRQSDHPITKQVDNVVASPSQPPPLPPKLRYRKEVSVSSSTPVSSTPPRRDDQLSTSPPLHHPSAPTTASNGMLNTESNSRHSKPSAATHSEPKSREVLQSNQPPPLPPKPKPRHKMEVSVPASSRPPTLPPRRNKFTQGRLVLYPPLPPAGDDYQPNPYVEYLRDMYGRMRPQFLVLQWPPPPTRKVFNLAMIHKKTIQCGPIDEELVRLLQRGNVADFVKERTTVQLQDIFRLDCEDRKIILIEGAPGSGKSTLAWHACQKWKARELFQEFRLVVFVQLRDPRVQSAKSLADLLPAGSEEKRRAAAEGIKAWEGRGVLFVLDGWDEYGPGLESDSIVSMLICKSDELDVPYSTLLITSRPIASAALQPLATSRVDIVGFTPEEVRQYFQEVVKDPAAVQALQEQLKDLPVIEASCYLPLNAAIVVHLFLALNHTLPRTLHRVFSALICGCIIRHLTRQSGKVGCIPEIPSLDKLPLDVQPSFKSLCLLAYEASMKNKATFSNEDLSSYGVSVEGNGLGLMQGVQSFLSGRSDSYHFLHLSVQELLAAVHVSKLGAGEQVSIFRELFSEPRLVAMFRFFAALTKLESEGIREVIASVIVGNMPSDDDSYYNSRKAIQWREHILNVLHCLYEAQDSSLCLFVMPLLDNALNLGKISLSPLDCLCVGYFLRCVCTGSQKAFAVTLKECGLDNYRIGCILKELHKCVHWREEANRDTISTELGHINLHLEYNHIDGNGVHLISEFIMSNPRVIRSLTLSYNKTQDAQDGFLCLSRVLCSNFVILEVSLSCCHLRINDENGPMLVKMLRYNATLSELELGYNREIGDPGLQYIVEGMMKNIGIVKLKLWWCGIGEEGGRLLGRMLTVNRTLEVLWLTGNDGLGDVGIAAVGVSLKANSSLQELDISRCGYSWSGLREFVLCLKENSHLRKLIVDTMEEANSLVQERTAVNHLRRLHGQRDLLLRTV